MHWARVLAGFRVRVNGLGLDHERHPVSGAALGDSMRFSGCLNKQTHPSEPAAMRRGSSCGLRQRHCRVIFSGQHSASGTLPRTRDTQH